MQNRPKITLISSIFAIIILLGLNIVPITTVEAVTADNLPWDSNDEGDHYPCGYEIWCYHASLTLENGQKWDSAATFVYFMSKTRRGYSKDGLSYCRIRQWDRQTGKFYDDFQSDKFPGPFHTEKNVMNLTYYNNTAKGLYPDYSFHCEDDKNNIAIDLQCHATSSPCWLLKDPTKGILPWGLSGTGRVYFIPMLQVAGKISINGTSYNATGVAYYEHDFVNCDFARPLAFYSLKELRNNLKLISSVAKWWASEVINNRPKQSPALHLSNDYFIGWCWSWIAFDNGWSMVMFRPTISELVEYLVPAFLYLTKDGKNYTEIGCVYWKNNDVKYIERADIYIPVGFNVTGYKGDMKLEISFTPTTEMTELFNKDFSSSSKQESCTFYCCGNVTGRYTDKENNITLKGYYSIEQTRWISALSKNLRHLSLDVETLLPPEGLGISIRRVSHLIGIEEYFKIQLKPKFDFKFYVRRAPDN